MITNSNAKMARAFLAGLIMVSCGHMAIGTHAIDALFYGSHDEPDFVIRWQYQYFCDHVYDPRTDIWRWPTDSKHGATFDPSMVKPGDTIFIRAFTQFFTEMHPFITCPYIVVSAGECLDQMADEHKQYLDEDKVIAWYGVHPNKMAMQHPKFHPLPLGILQDPYFYGHRKRINQDFKTLRTTTQKEYLVYVNFACQDTKPERKKLKKRFMYKPYCKCDDRIDFKDYLRNMAKSIFTLSPEGLGPDCYRTWEALLVGSIPVVKRSCLDPLYQDLPILIVDSWDDVTEEFLKEAYQKITAKKYNINRLYASYWTDQIKETQRIFRKGKQ